MDDRPDLKAALNMLLELHEMSVNAIFIFDGPNRPSAERNALNFAKPGALRKFMVDEFTTIIELCGFSHRTVYAYRFSFPPFAHVSLLQASGEAEAELALMNRLGHIDTILTDDNDALLFGGQSVTHKYVFSFIYAHLSNLTTSAHRKRTLDQPRRNIKVYTADRILEKCDLDRYSLILVALLSGCNYDPVSFVDLIWMLLEIT